MYLHVSIVSILTHTADVCLHNPGSIREAHTMLNMCIVLKYSYLYYCTISKTNQVYVMKH